MDSDECRQAVARHLMTDLLLGIQEAPLRIRAVRGVRPAAPPPAGGPSRAPRAGVAGLGSAAGPAGAPPAAAGIALQKISAAELARRQKELAALDEQQVKVCRKCELCRTRTKTVFGQGHAGARLVFVGEAPGADEDAQGLAFVGRAGQLLTRMIEAGMGLTRDQVFICNILKCRPPDNRTPAPDEIAACWPYLDKQLQIIQPEVIVALGKPAAQTLLRTTESIGRLRGNWHQYYTSGMVGLGPATMLMPTFHPAYLLRNPAEKGKAWSDLKMVMQQLGLPLPAR